MEDNDFIPERKYAPYSLGRVLVLGLGRSGKAVVRYCVRLLGTRVDELYIAAGKQTEDAQAFLEQLSIPADKVKFGNQAVSDFLTEIMETAEEPAMPIFDLCIASPGIPPATDLFKQASEISGEVISEVEFAWRESRESSRWIGVTGTNGKSTVTACIAHLLGLGGYRVSAVGNIGNTCTTEVEKDACDIYVAELSSYQLAETKYFAPDIAVLLNITPDHLAWHKTYEAYQKAKFKIFANLNARPDSYGILDTTNDIVRAEARFLLALGPDRRKFPLLCMGTDGGITCDARKALRSPNSAFLREDGMLCLGIEDKEIELINRSELLIPGEHNVSNALMSASAAVLAGEDLADVREGLRTFKSLEHRIERCGSINGVICYNDSKATNVDATLKALASFPHERVIALFGGDDKGTNLESLVCSSYEHLFGVICFGQAGKRFEDAFNTHLEGRPEGFIVRRVAHMEDALDCALTYTKKDDIILLSPACASFDEFHSFEERGTIFKELVRKRSS
ncbi:MAG: UDP-N-acetylmuramoyl-L-alanine--D-glutamate ligase [Eggerthellaceae bacterium]|jgi:UDP-N-acetylmuramoylalanine--D-glutamate ligase